MFMTLARSTSYFLETKSFSFVLSLTVGWLVFNGTLTSIRSTVHEQRLESLIMLQIHRSDTSGVDAVIDRFASSAASTST